MVLPRGRRQLPERTAAGAPPGRVQPSGRLVPGQTQHPSAAGDPQQGQHRGEWHARASLHSCLDECAFRAGLRMPRINPATHVLRYNEYYSGGPESPLNYELHRP